MLDPVGTLVRLVLAAIWLVSGTLKLFDRFGTVVAVGAYDVMPDRVVPVVASVLPLLEIALGVLLLVGAGTRAAAVVSAVLQIVFIGGLAQAWIRGLSIDCGCFGGGGPVAPGETEYGLELVRDLGFLALAGWMIVRPRTLVSLDALWAPAAPRDDAQRERNDMERVG
ncbi:methylamine utilization protein MauE [Pseudonocardia endophytica]|uniref:Methylamine utilization protein MauE n=1 Tax=Pseudonocardia endophytica TaxID=401976 RepID=A0A4R1HVR7_PSEEN|nr:methylamine utilization protein MauE [Pseudonocardia endophytica]